MIKAETIINNNQVAIRVHTPDGNHTDITVNEAMELATTLYNNAVEAAGLEALITRDDNPNKPLDNRYARIGDNYSIFNWKRAATGIYVTTAANGLRISVFKRERGSWYAQIGDSVLNEKKPVPTKVEAIALVEDTLVNA